MSPLAVPFSRPSPPAARERGRRPGRRPGVPTRSARRAVSATGRLVQTSGTGCTGAAHVWDGGHGTAATLCHTRRRGESISTPSRQAAFLAQVCHESDSLRYTLELADGKGYAGRVDLGNTQPGDGPRFRGRGLIQITGRANYRDCGDDLSLDLISHPELLEAPTGASRSAGWFWRSHGCRELADADKFGSLTRVINGAYNGLDDRIQHWLRARRALGVA